MADIEISKGLDVTQDLKKIALTMNLLTRCKRCHDAFHKAAGGPVHAVVESFLTAKKKFEVRELPAVYQYRLTA